MGKEGIKQMISVKKVFKVMGLFALIAIISSIVLFLMWKQNENVKLNGIRLPYLDDATRFEVHYPYNWETAKGKIKQDSKKGMTIYINKDKADTIYCYYAEQPIDLDTEGYQNTSFITSNGLKGNMYSKEENERRIVDVVFDNQKYGIHVEVSNQNWEQYEDDIMKIMESFIIIQ